MNRLEHEIARDLRQIADRATPSPDAWNSILTRIEEQDPDTETEIIMLTEAAPRSNRRWLLFASAAAAVVAIIGATVFAFAANDTSDHEEPPSPADTVTPTNAIVTTPVTAVDDHGALEGRWSSAAIPISRIKANMLHAGVTQAAVDDWVLQAGSPTEFTFTLEFHGDDFSHFEKTPQVALHVDQSGTLVYDQAHSRLTLSLVDQGATYEFVATTSCCDNLSLQFLDATDDLDAIRVLHERLVSSQALAAISGGGVA